MGNDDSFDPITSVRYDERTLFKVHRALMDSGLDYQAAIDAINNLQNAGILFRERA